MSAKPRSQVADESIEPFASVPFVAPSAVASLRPAELFEAGADACEHGIRSQERLDRQLAHHDGRNRDDIVRITAPRNRFAADHFSWYMQCNDPLLAVGHRSQRLHDAR